VLIAAVALAGCGHRSSDADPSAPVPRWPPPPDPARIEYLDTVRVPRDLGIRRSWMARIVRRVVHGPLDEGMARPYGIATSSDGLIVVTDPDARSVHLFDVAQSRYVRVTEAGGEPLVSPIGAAAGPDGRLYISDSVRATIHVLDSEGATLATWGGDGRLERPTGLAFDRTRGTLWVTDTGAHRVLGFDVDGRQIASIGGRGSGDGEFNYPVSVAVGPDGRLFVTDSMNFRVQIFDASGRFLSAFGRGGTRPGDFDKAKGIALDSSGHVYVVEGLHDVVQIFDDTGRLLTVVGGTGAGPGEFCLPAGIHIDGSDRILIADSANHRIQVLRYVGDPLATGPGS
jgi:DNA-binding beta-propeller fold protein YncE